MFRQSILLLLLLAATSAFVLPSAGINRLAFVQQQQQQQQQPFRPLVSLSSTEETTASSEEETTEAATEVSASAEVEVPAAVEETEASASTTTTSEEEEASTSSDDDSSATADDDDAAPAAPAPAAAETSDVEPKRVLTRERFTIFAGNLPFDTNEEAMRELFSKHGKVEIVSLPKNKNTGNPRGFAFVDMSTKEEMEAAIAALDGQQYEGRVLRIGKSVPKEQQEKKQDDGMGKIYVGNFPFTATKDAVMEFFSDYVDIVELYLPMNPDTGDARGFAFLTVKEEDVERTIEATDGLDFEGRPLTVNKPLPPGKKAPRRQQPGGDRTKIYVGNLSFYTVPDTLYQVFEEFGTVHDCYFPEDVETGGSRGFAFITMDKEAAQNAINEIDGCELDGRMIRVNEAQPKGARKPAPRNDDEDGDDSSDDFGSSDDE